MPPKRTSEASGSRGRPKAANNGKKARERAATESDSDNPFESGGDDDESVVVPDSNNSRRGVTGAEAEEEEQPEKSIPKDLLTRLLHEFFEKDSTRISRDANAAVGKYVDVFVREAIARTAVEKQSGFLEVDDLEKVAPQLLLDL